jgi:hypothetical protein
MSKRRHISGEKTGYLEKESHSVSIFTIPFKKISKKSHKNIDAHFSRLNFIISNRYFQNVFLLLSMFIKVGKTSSSDCV